MSTIVERSVDLPKLIETIQEWDFVTTKKIPEGTAYFVNGQVFAIFRGERIFLRIDPEVERFIIDWPGIFPVRGAIQGIEGWIQVVSLKAIYTGIRGLLRTAYENASSLKGQRL